MPTSSNQRKALFIDTSGESAQVALITEGEIADNIIWSIGPAAGKEVLKKINKLLKGSDIKLNEIARIAVHSGPGQRSSTLRAGITVATFLAFACGAKLVVVKASNKDELADAVFTASPQVVVQPVYDKPGFDSNPKKA